MVKPDTVNKFPNLWQVAKLLVLALPTSYLVERGFSAVVQLLTKQRNRLDISQSGELRLLLTDMKPDLKGYRPSSRSSAPFSLIKLINNPYIIKQIQMYQNIEIFLRGAVSRVNCLQGGAGRKSLRNADLEALSISLELQMSVQNRCLCTMLTSNLSNQHNIHDVPSVCLDHQLCIHSTIHKVSSHAETVVFCTFSM